MPAPAVTYTGQLNLPATITVAPIPLAADQELSALPEITSETDDGTTTWTLPGGRLPPHEAGPLQLVTALDRCSVLQ
jgi:hypothetical protein